MRKDPFFVIIFFSFSYFCNQCKSKGPEIGPDGWPTDTIRTVKSGLNFPWEILWGKDDHIWMTEREGKISKIDPKTGTTVFSATLPEVVSNGEGGLLGM